MKVTVVKGVSHFSPHANTLLRSASLLVLVLLFAAVAVTAQEPKVEPKPAANTPAPPESQAKGDELVIIDTNRLPCPYDYGQGGTQNNIYFSRRDFDRVNQAKDLTNVVFYLAPLPEIDTVELKQKATTAAEAKIDVNGKTTILKRLKLPGIPLLTEERKAAAVQSINDHYKFKGTAAVSTKQVKLAPYRALEVAARLKNGRTLGTVRVDNTQGLQRYFRIDIEGTDDELMQFVEDPVFTVRFQSHGFIPKVNELSASMQLFFAEGFHHFLTGEADFKAWQTASTSNSAKGVSFPPYLFKRSSSGVAKGESYLKSWVTRDQIHEVISAYTTYIRINRIIEFNDDKSLVDVTGGLIQALIHEQDKVIVYFRANVDQQNKITFHVFDRDLTPDQLSDISQKTALKNKAELEKDVSVTYGGKEKGVDAKVDQKSKNDDALEFGRDVGSDKLYVPKSIKLFQLSLNSLEKKVKIDVKDIRMTFVDNVPQSTPALYVGYQHKTLRALHTHIRRVNGKELKHTDGDHCIGIGDGEPADVSFRAVTSFTKKTIDVRLEFTTKETYDETTYVGKETVSIPVEADWEAERLEGNPTTSYAITNQKLLIRERSAKRQFPNTNLDNLIVVREVNASEIQFAPDKMGAPGAYIPTLANPKNTRGGGHLSKSLPPVDLKGTHLSSLILKLDTSDSGGKRDAVAAAIGYDVSFEIPYRAVRRVVASDPEHLRGLLSQQTN